jgi:uncharacterized membrane protein YdjX (TVP38/TMEM64 family)
MKLISAAVLISFVIFMLNSEIVSILLSGDPEALEHLPADSIATFMAFAFALMLIQNSVPIAPLLLLVSINVTVLDFTFGFFWSWIASLAGASLAFLMSRYWFQDLFMKYVNNKVKRKIEEKGFWYVFLGRVIPVVPTSIINIAAGGSTIRFATYFYATLLGNLIFIFLIALASIGLLTVEWEYAATVTIIVLVAAIYLFLRLRKRRHPKRTEPEKKE